MIDADELIDVSISGVGVIKGGNDEGMLRKAVCTVGVLVGVGVV